MCSRNHSTSYSEDSAQLQGIKFGAVNDNKTASGEWIGLVKTNKVGSEILSNAVTELSKTAEFNKLKLPDLMNYLLEKKVKINVMYIDGHWMDVDSYADVSKGQKF